MAYSKNDSGAPLRVPHNAPFMTLFSTAQHIVRGSRGHLIPMVLAAVGAAGAMALVAYLLWPTWGAQDPSNPARLPVSVGATLFNVPTMAVRMKIQRHSGPQERVDLNFTFPSLEVPEAPKHVSADTSPRTMTRWRRTPGCAPSIRAISSRPRRRRKMD
jgi:hypothetical protein